MICKTVFWNHWSNTSNLQVSLNQINWLWTWKEEFIKLCQEYGYVAIGGIVTGEIKQTEYKYFHWFINTAHEHDCKIHGLGFTSLKGLYEYHFDSVDSTTWCVGARYGYAFRFNGRRMEIYENGGRKGIKKTLFHELNRNNLMEWLKFQRYADTHL